MSQNFETTMTAVTQAEVEKVQNLFTVDYVRKSTIDDDRIRIEIGSDTACFAECDTEEVQENGFRIDSIHFDTNTLYITRIE